MEAQNLYIEAMLYALDNPLDWEHSKKHGTYPFIFANYRHIDLGRNTGKTESVSQLAKQLTHTQVLVVTPTAHRAQSYKTNMALDARSIEELMNKPKPQGFYRDTTLLVLDDVSYRNALDLIATLKPLYFIHLGQG